MVDFIRYAAVNIFNDMLKYYPIMHLKIYVSINGISITRSRMSELGTYGSMRGLAREV
jgi:hypothetical protein